MPMQYNNITFAQPYWLWGLLLIPIVILFFKLATKKTADKQLANFADPELLPHLLANIPGKKPMVNLLSLWCLLWLIGVIAMANPRWKFIEYETYKPDAALVVVLDLAQSMSAEDLKPSRIVRAKQQIQDILTAGRGVRVGLVGFAKVPHLITPITDDFGTILHLLPAIDIDLISKQGGDISAALQMASKLLQAEPGESKHILLISDGNFKNNYIDAIKTLTAKNILLHVAAVGTEQGAPFKDATGAWKKVNNELVIAKLNIDILQGIAKLGSGKYWQVNYGDQDTASLVQQILGNGVNNQVMGTTTVRQWEEGFFWLLFPMLVLALLLQRKHLQLGLYMVAIMLCMPEQSMALDLFHNNAQQGKILFDNGEYEKAAEKFADPYKRGVALYKAGQFAAAEQAFNDSSRPAVALQAKYNLGNAQLKQGKYKQAIDTYEVLLKEDPDNTLAKDNLALAKKLLKDKENQSEQENNKSCPNVNKNQQDKDANSKGDKDNTDNKDNNKQASTNSEDDNQASANKNINTDDKGKPEQSAAQESTAKDQQPTTSPQELGKGSANNKDDADLETEVWLQRLNNDIKTFMKNKFLIEEQ